MVETADAEPLRHMIHQQFAWLQNAVDLCDRGSYLFAREMEYAVAEPDIDNRFAELNDVAFSRAEIEVEIELGGDRSGGQNRGVSG